jgi:hypothetical protein
MLLQAVPNAIVQKIDSLRVLTESVVNAQQTQSVEIESIRDSVHTQLAAVTAQLDTIPAFGVKYGDTMAYIAIPLIIALFAFAFMYMLSVITRVNQKYDSESINQMFKTSGTYCCYLVSSTLGIAYVLGFGLTTCITDISQGAMRWLSILGVIIAGFFAVCVLLFVLACLRYDNHYPMLKVMGNRYRRHRRRQRSYDNYKNRLIDLCKYAIRARDNRLYEDLLELVNKYGKAVKPKTADQVNELKRSFYSSIVEEFVQTPTGGEMERNLFRHWEQTLRHDELLDPKDYYYMLDGVVGAVKRGQRYMFEAYAEMCRYGFNFINQTAEVKYIIGSGTEEQKSTDDKSLIIWNELREAHFLAAAYLFSLGHFEVANVFKKRSGSERDLFFPMTLSEVLKLYADCKARQDVNTGQYHFEHWNNEVIAGNDDREILEKFTAMLVLMMRQLSIDGNMIIVSQKKMRLLADSKEQIIRFGEIWKSHQELRSRFPQIRNVNIERIFDAGMSRLSDGAQMGQPNIFEWSLPSSAKKPVKELFESFFRTGKSNLTDSLAGINENKDSKIGLNKYTFLVDKQSLLTPDKWTSPAVQHDMTKIFWKRYLHAFYEVLSEMRIKDIKTKRAHFGNKYLKIVGDNGSDYLMISTDYDFKTKLQVFGPASLFEAKTVLPSELIRDLPTLQPFVNTITVIKKKDLPALKATSKEKKTSVGFNDESDKDEGRANVRVTVYPPYAICYSKDAEIYRFHFKD